MASASRTAPVQRRPTITASMLATRHPSTPNISDRTNAARGGHGNAYRLRQARVAATFTLAAPSRLMSGRSHGRHRTAPPAVPKQRRRPLASVHLYRDFPVTRIDADGNPPETGGMPARHRMRQAAVPKITGRHPLSRPHATAAHAAANLDRHRLAHRRDRRRSPRPVTAPSRSTTQIPPPG